MTSRNSTLTYARVKILNVGRYIGRSTASFLSTWLRIRYLSRYLGEAEGMPGGEVAPTAARM